MKRIIIGTILLVIITIFGVLASSDLPAMSTAIYFIFWYVLFGFVIYRGYKSYSKNKKQV